MDVISDDYIEDFLRGVLPLGERAAFFKRLATDEKLRQRTDRLRFDVLETDLQRMQTIREALTEPLPPPPAEPGPSLWPGALFVLLALLLAGVLWWSSTRRFGEMPGATPTLQQPSIAPAPPPRDSVEERIPAEVPPASSPNPLPESRPAPPIARTPTAPASTNVRQLALANYRASVDYAATSRSGIDTSFLQRAANALFDGKTDDARFWLNQVSSDTPEADFVEVLYAHLLFAEANYAEAAIAFRQVLNDPAVYRDDLEWALLLTVLARDETPSPTTDSLLSIMTDSLNFHQFAPRAIILRDSLKR
jgi:hypothetical protein